jgi:CheY-specific phosphatase CheX
MSIEVETAAMPGLLSETVLAVFETMVGLAVEEHGAEWEPGARRLTAAVHLSGEWNGAVLVECDHVQACRFAAHFLSIPLPRDVDDVVRDVLGELANMIGGNLKCVLQRGIVLSSPVIVEGADCSVRIPGEFARERRGFATPEGDFRVTLVSARRTGAACG